MSRSLCDRRASQEHETLFIIHYHHHFKLFQSVLVIVRPPLYSRSLIVFKFVDRWSVYAMLCLPFLFCGQNQHSSYSCSQQDTILTTDIVPFSWHCKKYGAQPTTQMQVILKFIATRSKTEWSVVQRTTNYHQPSSKEVNRQYASTRV